MNTECLHCGERADTLTQGICNDCAVRCGECSSAMSGMYAVVIETYSDGAEQLIPTCRTCAARHYADTHHLPLAA